MVVPVEPQDLPRFTALFDGPSPLEPDFGGGGGVFSEAGSKGPPPSELQWTAGPFDVQ